MITIIDYFVDFCRALISEIVVKGRNNCKVAGLSRLLGHCLRDNYVSEIYRFGAI